MVRSCAEDKEKHAYTDSRDTGAIPMKRLWRGERVTYPKFGKARKVCK